ncbi:PAS domain-containing hybrid sensor histidine kinase/response regulator [Thermosulfuriphilus sp.]
MARRHSKRASEQSLLDILPVHIGGIDSSGKFVIWNPASQEVFGYRPQEVIGRMSPTDFHADPEEARIVLETTLKKGAFRGVVRLRRRDGSSFWAHLEVVRQDGPSGEYQGMIAVAVDLTAYLEDRKAFRESEEKYRIVFDNAPLGLFFFDKEGNIKTCNDALVRIVGSSREKILQLNVFDLPNSRVIEAARKALSGKRASYEGEYIPITSNKFLYIRAEAVPVFSDSEVIGAVSLIEDITERKLTEEQLRQSESRLRAIINALPDMIFRLDSRGNFLDLHVQDTEKLYVPPEEIIGSNVSEILPPSLARLTLEKIRQALDKGRMEIFKYQLPTRSGEILIYEARLNPCAPDEVLGIVRDVTEQKRMEEEIIRAQKLESLAVLAGGIAHDFNNILTALLGNLSLAKIFAQGNEKVCSILEKAERSCLRAKSLTQQLLTFSKGGEPVKDIVDIGDLIRETAEFVLAGSNVRCLFDLPPDLWSVEADRDQIVHVLNNLLINADQAMPEGGVVRVKARNLVVEAADGLPLAPGKYVKISVKDQGVGIPKKYLDKIFDPFFTTKKKGSGLGLATAYSIVKKHQGHIAVKSRPGRGANFMVYLPAAEAKKVSTDPEEAPLKRGQGRVLIMDDEDMVRDILKNMLRHLGYEVEETADGRQAVDSYRAAWISGHPHDVLIMDLTVPGGMGGREAVREILKINPQAKVIVSSGYSTDPVMANYDRYGFCGVIAKPYKIGELSQVLSRILEIDP